MSGKSRGVDARPLAAKQAQLPESRGAGRLLSGKAPTMLRRAVPQRWAFNYLPWDFDAERILVIIMSLPALLVLLVIAAICGAIGRALAGGGGGLITSIVIGFVGAFRGPLGAHPLTLV